MTDQPEDQIGAPPGTQAVLRAIRLLKAFSSDRPSMSLAELGAAGGLTRTTTHRLLAALASQGFVIQNRSRGDYSLGPGAVALGSQALLSSDLRRTVRPTLDSVAETTGETTTLEVLVGDQILVLDGIAGRHLVSANLDIGTCWPLFATSTGRIILANMPEAQRERLLQQPRAQLTERTVTEEGELRAELKRARERGFAATFEELAEGYVGIGAGFRGSSGQIEGAISVGGPASRFSVSRVKSLGAQLKAAADLLSSRQSRAG